MSLLANSFRAQVKQTKDISQINEMTYSISYPTGFFNLDMANGYVQDTANGKHFELGISDGSINMLISDSGVGKTTLATQIAWNIVKRFSNACVFYEQSEVGTNIQRLKNLTGLDNQSFNDRFIVRDAGITTESIYRRVKMIHDIKVDNASEYTYDTGLIDDRGDKVFKYTPTVVIVDSVKLTLSEKNAEADETNNMTGATTAKTNSEYYTKMVPLCREANIIMLLINHITVDVNTGFMPKKPVLPYLKQGEAISGGKSLTYIQNNIFRLDIKTKYKPEEGFGITGSAVNVDIVKSRTNKTSRARCCLVFDQETGYDNELSMFLMLKEEKLLEGSGAFLKLPGYDKKFSQKQFKTLLHTDPEFNRVFVEVCVDYMKKVMIEEYDRIKSENEVRKNDTVYDNIISNIGNGFY
jgi:RecA/RadA recombinase